MLVLSRKVGQSISVGDVRIMLVALKGSSAKIGIEAPEDLLILREEVEEETEPAPAEEENCTLK